MAMFCKYLASSLRFQAAGNGAPRVILLKLSPGHLVKAIHRRFTTSVGSGKSTGYPEVGDTCPISEFLLNECGFCQTELSVTFRRRPSFVTVRSTLRAQQVVQLLRDQGFTEQQMRKTVTGCPAILTCNADRILKPKFDVMKMLGLTAQDIRKLICNEPRVLSSSLEKTLSPNFQFLQNLFGSEAKVSNVLKWVPKIIGQSNGPAIFEKRLKHLVSFGLLEDDAKELVRREPRILCTSMDKVQKNMDFLMHTAGLPAKFLLSKPRLLSRYSLERRIKPRHDVLRAVRAMQPSERPLSLTTAVYLTERDLLSRYIQSSPHATKLLEIYSCKPALF